MSDTETVEGEPGHDGAPVPLATLPFHREIVEYKSFPTEAMARREAESLIREKLGKGYEEVQPG